MQKKTSFTSKATFKTLPASKVNSALAILSTVALSIAIGGASPAGAEQVRQSLKVPAMVPSPQVRLAPPRFRENILLVMPSKGADSEEVSNALHAVKGDIVKTIGEGELTCYVVKLEQGYMQKAEQELSRNKLFASVQRDYLIQAQQAAVNDPYFPSEWHLGALNVIRGWQVHKGGTSIIAVVDTGCNYNITELNGKTYGGYNAINKVSGQTDVQGHGTMVATTAAAITDNRIGTAAPARLSYIYPVRAADASGSFPESAVLEAIYKCGNVGVRILNLSANANPPYTFANSRVHPSFHTYARWYHDTKGGLLFNSAGNTRVQDPNPLVPYLIVVSAINPQYTLASFSTYGNCVWFTAPGQQIYCTTRSGQVTSVAGTSFSCPLTASIAALIWGANPGLRNTDIENIMKTTAYKAGSSDWTQWYGYGMPNAEAALKKALGQ